MTTLMAAAIEASTYDDLARVRDRCVRYEDSGCLLWTGALKANGYALAKVQGTMVLAHRLVASWWWGDLDGWAVHHVCGQPHCLERTHLVPMTRGDHDLEHATGRMAA